MSFKSGIRDWKKYLLDSNLIAFKGHGHQIRIQKYKQGWCTCLR